ncbi:helix-turn-helix domain-containing protein, partial [Frankia casuarinae]
MPEQTPARAPLWTVHDLARYLGVPVNTIYKWRTTGDGP